MSLVSERDGFFGWRQADAVCALCLSAGYEDVSVRSDLSGNPRCVLARRPIAF